MTLELTWKWPETPIAIAIVIVLAGILNGVVVFAIRRTAKAAIARSQEKSKGLGRVLDKATGLTSSRAEQRTRTLAALLTNFSSTAIWAVAVLTVLSIIGIPMGPLLASAGIGGIAVAFGAQSLVRDYLSGVFMVMEDQYGVGDFLHVGDHQGTVEEVTLRTTRLRDIDGTVWYLRNGNIDEVGNLTQGHSTGLVEIPVAPDTDPELAISVLNQVANEIAADPDLKGRLHGTPRVQGVDDIRSDRIVIRIKVLADAHQQGPVGRAIRQKALTALNKAGIDGPIPDG